MAGSSSINKLTLPAYFEVPLIDTPDLWKETLSQETIRHFFRKPFVVENNLIKITNEYILVGEAEGTLSLLKVRQTYRLKEENTSTSSTVFRIEVLRKHTCGPNARTFVLLKVIEGNSLRSINTFEVLDVFPDIEEVGQNSLGEIHPGKTGSGGSSEGYPNIYGINRPMLRLDLLNKFKKFPIPPKPVEGSVVNLKKVFSIRPTKNLIKVAVLDTGVRSPINLAKDQTRTKQSCQDQSTGWNFVNDTANVTDDHVDLHGTRISAIIRQECKSVQLIPVKTADENGVCELYNVLCGLEYARVNKARIINASFSFKTQPDSDIPLLNLMMKAVQDDGIWIIAAAGNASQYPKGADGNTPPLGENAPLNLPACYSRDSDRNHVVTVTTVSRIKSRSVNPMNNEPAEPTLAVVECYSNEFVDVGVVANGAADQASGDHTFAAPGFQPKPGTSYATAYVTGLVANRLQKHPITSKSQLIQELNPESHQELQTSIRDGHCMDV